jgi:hypothetical protein
MDIRLPLGLLFAVLGALLAGFGLTTISSRMYAEHSLGVNVNLWSGLGMLVFGGTLLWLSRVNHRDSTTRRRTED